MALSKFLAPVLALGLSACSKAPTPAAPTNAATAPHAPDTAATPAPAAPVALPELAKTILAALERGDMAAVQPHLNADMVKAVGTGDALVRPFAQLGKCPAIIAVKELIEGAFTTQRLTCKYASGPMDVLVTFDKDGKLAGLHLRPSTDAAAFGPRPQTPQPPFPYGEREVTFTNPADEGVFAGTLTLPSGPGPFPAAVLISGSGSQDRDETIFGHKPFLVIADALTRRGIAVLRVDDRGAGKTRAEPSRATLALHASDVEAAVRFVRTQPEIDPKRVGLIGHSEGGILAAMVAGRSDARRETAEPASDRDPVAPLAFIVSLAGTGVSGAELVPQQIGTILGAMGAAPEGVAEVVAGQKKICQLAMDGAPTAELEAAITETAAIATRLVGADKAAGLDESNKVAAAQLQSPWFRSFLKTDPRLHWGHVKTPVLALIGDRDTQVLAEQNLREIAAALAKAGNGDVTTETLAGLNHLFQPAKTGLLDEYETIAQTFDPAALERIASWIEKHVAPR